MPVSLLKTRGLPPPLEQPEIVWANLQGKTTKHKRERPNVDSQQPAPHAKKLTVSGDSQSSLFLDFSSCIHWTPVLYIGDGNVVNEANKTNTYSLCKPGVDSCASGFVLHPISGANKLSEMAKCGPQSFRKSSHCRKRSSLTFEPRCRSIIVSLGIHPSSCGFDTIRH